MNGMRFWITLGLAIGFISCQARNKTQLASVEPTEAFLTCLAKANPLPFSHFTSTIEFKRDELWTMPEIAIKYIESMALHPACSDLKLRAPDLKVENFQQAPAGKDAAGNIKKPTPQFHSTKTLEVPILSSSEKKYDLFMSVFCKQREATPLAKAAIVCAPTLSQPLSSRCEWYDANNRPKHNTATVMLIRDRKDTNVLFLHCTAPSISN